MRYKNVDRNFFRFVTVHAFNRRTCGQTLIARPRMHSYSAVKTYCNAAVCGVRMQVGFNEGDGNRSYSLPQSRTKDVINIRNASNIGQPGRWMYRVDDYNLRPCLYFFLFASLSFCIAVCY